MQSTEKKNIYILLTIYPDNGSKMLRKLCHWQYTHASIGLDGISGKFFSFVTKGFRIEDPVKHPTFKNQEVPCKLYCMPVSSAVYDRVKQIIEYHMSNSDQYSYSYYGVFMCLLDIAFKNKNSYFCSQFVAEVLEHGKVFDMQKPSSLYVPDDFSQFKDLKSVFTGTLKKLITMPDLLPLPA